MLIKTRPEFRELTSALVNLILETDLPRERKSAVIATIRDFIAHAILKTCVADVSAQQQGRHPSVSSLLEYRRATSGAWYETFARILNLLHDVPCTVGQKAETLLVNWAMAGEIVDDLMDVMADYGHEPNNLVTTLLAGYPEEKANVEVLLAQKIHFIPSYLPTIAPWTYQDLREILQSYLHAIRETEPPRSTAQKAAVSTWSSFLALSSPVAEHCLRVLLRIGAN